MQEAIAKYGQSTDPVWQRDIGEVLGRLRVAADVPDRDFHWIIINDSSFNAAAVPGGFMLVNVGLLTGSEKLAGAEFPRDSSARDRRFTSFLAAVLGHELAHHTLGHTSQAVGLLLARRGRNDSPEARLESAMTSPELIAKLARSRQREFAADRAGSLYLLRAGWTIQDMMDLFHLMDSTMERGTDAGQADAPKVPLVDSVRTLSWLADHPRSSEREAALEEFRGSLKRDQARFDDALMLVRTGLELDTAVVLVDSVLAHFPGLMEAQHLRAAALEQRYLRQRPVKDLRVRTSVATYPARFYTSIRGGRDVLEQARAAYRAVLHTQLLPYALSNLAVLDAYAGELMLARARADSAVRLDSTSYELPLNAGVVAYLGGRYRDALVEFRRARTLAGGRLALADFDEGRTLLVLGDSAHGRALLARYVRADEGTSWREYARLLSRNGADSVSRAVGGVPVVHALVSLGQSSAQVMKALGAPEQSQRIEGGILLGWPSRGISVIISARAGVIAMELRRPEAGSVDGIMVGAQVEELLQDWGEPDAVDDGTLHYQRGTLLVSISDDGAGMVGAITVAPMPGR